MPLKVDLNTAIKIEFEQDSTMPGYSAVSPTREYFTLTNLIKTLDPTNLIGWWQKQTSNPSSVNTIDVYGLTDNLNNTRNFRRIHLLYLENLGATRVVVGGTLGFLLGAGIALRPDGGVQLYFAPDAIGFSVTENISDTITITNSTGTATDYRILIVGRTV
jgi:hypothetical protein